MKKIIALFAFVCFFCVPAFAGMNSDFKKNFDIAGFSQYNHDISTLIGMADFHTGQGATFPGVDIGATLSAVRTADDNFADDEYFYAPFITAETQLPILGIGIAARGTSYNDFESLGGGLKWTGNVATIHLAAGLFYDRFKTDYYDGDHFSASASASLDLVVLTPYIGIGYDYSEMETKHFLTNHKTDDDAVRYTAGINIHPFPFVYLYGAYTYTKNSQGVQGGVGIHF